MSTPTTEEFCEALRRFLEVERTRRSLSEQLFDRRGASLKIEDLLDQNERRCAEAVDLAEQLLSRVPTTRDSESG